MRTHEKALAYRDLVNAPRNRVRTCQDICKLIVERFYAVSDNVCALFFLDSGAIDEGENARVSQGLEALEHGLGEGMRARLEAEDAHLLVGVLYVLPIPQRPPKVSIDAWTGLNFANWPVRKLVLGTAHLLAHLWTEARPKTRPPFLIAFVLGLPQTSDHHQDDYYERVLLRRHVPFQQREHG